MTSERPLLTPSPTAPSPPTYTNSTPLRSPSKRVTISTSKSRNSTHNSSDGFSFNPHLQSSFRSSSPIEPLPPSRSSSTKPPVPFASRRSDSNRYGSQKEISDEDARFVFVSDPDRTNSPVGFPNNSIKTTKYNLITFLPRNLFEQFHRVAYVYFLVLAGLNQIPQLGVLSPAASILPLAFVLGVTAIKDGYEDWRRHRSDQTENNRTASVLVGSEFEPRPWKSVRVGDVIRVEANDALPCDMVLLSTSDPTGVAYVQTINLDGESNLKTRYAKQETQLLAPNQVSGLIRCEKPNRNIYGFHANVDIEGKRVSLGPSNIILRGCQLKNTNWVIGIAVYTVRKPK